MTLIAGPCVIEDYKTLDETAQYLCNAIERKHIDFYFKSSAVKDNRTSVSSYSGVGMEKGIKFLQQIKKSYDIKITTDFHNINDIIQFGEEVDLIQIPAFLAKQTSLLKATALINKPVHIKKPQFVGPTEAFNIYQNIISQGYKKIYITDRGTMFGYNQTIIDPRHISIMKEKIPNVLVDITHPNKNYFGDVLLNSTTLAKSAIVSGADGIFLETHPDCNQAKCDSNTMIPSQYIENIIKEIYQLWEFVYDKNK